MQQDQSYPMFPERALPSKAVLYRPLQDIDIFVEDEGSEVFYKRLLGRLAQDIARIATVIPLRGRINVINKCQQYTEKRPAVFIVDGDLEWVAGKPLPSYKHLYIHPCYCIENYLFCEKAMVEIVVENTGTLSEAKAKQILGWASFRKSLKKTLLQLFVEFATVYLLCPHIGTVSRGIGECLRDEKGKLPRLDAKKIKGIQKQLRSQVVAEVGAIKYLKARKAIKKRIMSFSDPLDAVSGKDFLIPLQMFEITRASKRREYTKSFVFKLSKYCNLGKLDKLKTVISKAMAVPPEAA